MKANRRSCLHICSVSITSTCGQAAGAAPTDKTEYINQRKLSCRAKIWVLPPSDLATFDDIADFVFLHANNCVFGRGRSPLIDIEDHKMF